MAGEGLYYTRAGSKLWGTRHGGAQLMPVPPPKKPGCFNFGVGMPHARSGGDALRALIGRKGGHRPNPLHTRR